MAILDTFTVIYESDTAGLEQGLNDSRQQAGRLNDELQEADDNAKTATTSIGQAFKAVATLAAGFLAAGAAQQRFSETVDNLEAIGRTADTLGIAATDVDAFSRSLVSMGGDAQGARDSLVDMAESIGEAVADVESGRAEVYRGLGITLQDVNGQAVTATEGMLRLADAVSDMSREEAIFRVRELGVTDNRTIEMILRGRQEMEKMLAVQKEQSAVTEDSVENARLYREAMFRLNNSTESITTQLAVALIPTLISVIDALAAGVNWIRDNQELVTGFFIAIAAVVATTYLPAMVSAASATLVAIAPFLLIAAAIAAAAAAFALIYEDIVQFMRGNDSFIGQIIEQYPALGRVIMNVIEAVQNLFDVFGRVLDWISEKSGVSFGSIGEAIQGFITLLLEGLNTVAEWGEAFAGYFQDAADNVVGIFEWLWEKIQSILSLITGAFASVTAGIDKVTGTVSGAMDTVGGWFGIGDDDEEDDDIPTIGINMANARLNNAANDPMNSVTNQQISNSGAAVNESNVSIGEVTVQTQATDASGVARDMGSELNRELRNVNSESATGIAR